MKKPNLFIVGAQKSGTTALYQFLKQHPDIFMSGFKEPRFFCKDRVQESDNFYKKRAVQRYDYYKFREEEDYLNLFTNWRDEKIAGEGTTVYLYSNVAASEIHKFNPKAKIIIMIRNPVDFLYSLHSHLLSGGWETVKDFRKALALEEERKQGKRLPKYSLLSQPSALFYFDKSKFSEQIQRYYDVFDKKQIKIIIFDDFRNDNGGVYREVLKFLGVDPNFIPNFEEVNVNKKARLVKLRILIRSSMFIKVLKISKYVFPQKIHAVFKKTYQKLEKFLNMHVFSKKEPRSPMDLELRKELIRKLKPEVKELSKIVGRDLVALWGY